MGCIRSGFGAIGLALVLLLAACGGGGAGGDAAPAPSGVATLGSDGGRVLAESAEVVVPPGAMASSTTIRIAADSTGAPALPRWAKGAGTMLQLTPHGRTFAEPVTVRLAAPDVTLAANERLLIAKAQPGGTWEVLGDTELVEGQLEAKVTSFSYFTPVVVSYVQSTTPTILRPFGMGPVTFTCNGAPCVTPVQIGTPVRAASSGNGGQLPTNCVNPKIQLRYRSDALQTVDATPSAVLDLLVPWSRIAGRYVDGSFGLYVYLVCIDPVTNASSAISVASGRLAIDSFSSSAGAPVIRSFPTDQTRAPGDQLTFPVRLSRGASYRTSFNTFAAPTPTDTATVYLERLAVGDTVWRNVATRLQTSATTNSASVGAWAYWSVEFPLGAVSTTDNGARYRVRACYQAPTATTASCNIGPVATLTVVQQTIAPMFTQQPASMSVVPGQTANFSARAGGTPAPSLQWQTRAVGEINWVAASGGSGATSADFTTGVLTLADNGRQYRVLATNAAGSTASEAVVLSVSAAAVAPTISSQPVGLTVVAGSEALFAVSAQGTAALSYQWLRNGVAISGANGAQLKLPAVSAGDAASYSVRISNSAGSVTSAGAVLTVSATPSSAPVAPTIVTQPAAVAVNEGNVATFAVGVTGSGPMTFQWRRNGAAITGATAAAYTIPAVSSANAGTYSVVVGNAAGAVTSQSATLAVVPSTGSLVAPTISVQPASVVTVPRATATLAVSASGSGPLTYQWFQDGSPTSSVTGPTLTFDSVDAISNGSYTVTVSNAAGSVTSAPAQLLVVGAPQITTQPQAASVAEGATATFGVQASGDLLRFQWSRNGVAIDGAVDASFTTDPLTLADSGAVYAVIVYNGAGLVTSAGAVLTVAPPSNPPGLVLFAGAFGEVNNVGNGDGTGTAARFNEPRGLVADASGNVYVANRNGGFVSKVTPGAVVTRIADHSFSGALALDAEGGLLSMQVAGGTQANVRVLPPLQAGAATQARTCGSPVCGGSISPGRPFAAIAADGTVYTAWQDANLITVTSGPISEVNPPIAFFAGTTDLLNRPAGWVDGTGTNARFDGPSGIALGPDGNLYVADTNNHVIRRITPAGVVSTFAGTGTVAGAADGALLSATFNRPLNLGFDSEGGLWVMEVGPAGAPRIGLRKIAGGQVSTPVADLQAEIDTVAGGPSSSAVINGFTRVYGGLAVIGPKRLAFSVTHALLVLTLP